ncbi:PEGA domain-containing protein [Deinococcus arenicola]|uniref:PEGA domain-containing protein n=1 Tax=Deinococcus arenicola TaxID=2994950 RepID=A0ABU4DQE0_9DEIO|nr:PEGA domain-containing protein [Deinococcus sp. ZS9-10]MDV6374649.1 PEGA domain-containing protein [Deinococcus sp. ZS9-10]
MKRRAFLPLSGALLLTGLLSACVPSALQAQPGAVVGVAVNTFPAPVRPVTGEERLYREPGPAALQIRTDRPAFVTAVVVPQAGGAQVIPVGAVAADAPVSVTLPPTWGFIQVFTVTSLAPLDLGAAAGARSLAEVAQVVQASATSLPRGSYTVATTVFRVVRFGNLEISASPAGSDVSVDGRRVGTTPLTLRDVPEGRVTVEVSRDGYDTVSQQVQVGANTTAQLRTDLQRETGTLRVSSAVAARVLIGGQGAGSTPLSVKLRPGTVNVNVIPLDPAARTETLLVRVKAREDTDIACQATPEFTCSVR